MNALQKITEQMKSYRIDNLEDNSDFKLFVLRMLKDNKLTDRDKIELYEKTLEIFFSRNILDRKTIRECSFLFTPEIAAMLMGQDKLRLIEKYSLADIYPDYLIIYRDHYTTLEKLKKYKNNKIIKIINPHQLSRAYIQSINQTVSNQVVLSVYLDSSTIDDLTEIIYWIKNLTVSHLTIELSFDEMITRFSGLQIKSLIKIFCLTNLVYPVISANQIKYLILGTVEKPEIFNEIEYINIFYFNKHLYDRSEMLFDSVSCRQLFDKIFNQDIFLSCSKNFLKFRMKISRFPLVLEAIAIRDQEYYRLLNNNYQNFRQLYMNNFNEIYHLLMKNNLYLPPFIRLFEDIYNSMENKERWTINLDNYPPFRDAIIDKYLNKIGLTDFTKFIDGELLNNLIRTSSKKSFIFFLKILFEFLNLDTDELITRYYEMEQNARNNNSSRFLRVSPWKSSVPNWNLRFITDILPKIVKELRGIDLDYKF